MFTTYTNLSDSSRVWVYQSDRGFTAEEAALISSKTTDFIEQWTGHGANLKGSFTLKYHQFLILAVDQDFNNASGCAIDASVRFIQQLEEELHVDLMHKMNVSFKEDDQITIVKLSAFQQLVKEGKITKDTTVFNNMVQTKGEIASQWEVPVHQSWHKRFLV